MYIRLVEICHDKFQHAIFKEFTEQVKVSRQMTKTVNTVLTI